jgi:hypothetical protein
MTRGNGGKAFRSWADLGFRSVYEHNGKLGRSPAEPDGFTTVRRLHQPPTTHFHPARLIAISFKIRNKQILAVKTWNDQHAKPNKLRFETTTL